MTYAIIDRDFLKSNVPGFLFLDMGFPGGSWTEENFLVELPDKWRFSLALIIGGKMAGFIIASKKADAIHIHRFAIAAEFRLKGLGAWLLNEFEHRCKQQKEYVVSLKAAIDNVQAIKFYKKHGFMETDTSGNNILMKKKLKRVVAIHQPNFFPWLGFFSKIKRCDVFVCLNHVENRPNDAIYTKRVAILNNNEVFWLTVPLLKPKSIEFVRICDMKINTTDNFKKKHLKTIEQNYKKKPFYDEVIPFVNEFYNSGEDLIALRNIQFVKSICLRLKIDAPHVMSSDYSFSENSTELLIQLTKAVQGDVYLAGGGAVKYQEDSKFAEAGLEVLYNNFEHPTYNQGSAQAFVKGLSIIDALMNIGFDKVSQLI
jgi:GNAT superfamily N-acetyltransferase